MCRPSTRRRTGGVINSNQKRFKKSVTTKPFVERHSTTDLWQIVGRLSTTCTYENVIESKGLGLRNYITLEVALFDAAF